VVYAGYGLRDEQCQTNHKLLEVVVAGWLGATYHLALQGYDVTLLEAGPVPGGLVAGWKTAGALRQVFMVLVPLQKYFYSGGN